MINLSQVDVLATCDTSMGKVMHLPWKVNKLMFWQHVTQAWESHAPSMEGEQVNVLATCDATM